MNIFDQFISESDNIQLLIDSELKEIDYSPLTNEALFHLPFLALSILCIAKGQRKVTTTDLGMTFSRSIERTIPGYKHSSQMVSWSANLRLRTAKALEFLECGNLATVSHDRSIKPSKNGRILINGVLCETSFLGLTLRKLQRNFNDLKSEINIDLI